MTTTLPKKILSVFIGDIVQIHKTSFDVNISDFDTHAAHGMFLVPGDEDRVNIH